MKPFRLAVFLASLWLFATGHGTLRAQDGVGMATLKIDPGARPAGMAGVSSGIGDDAQSLYANPGGIGHLRWWQWSVSYNRWFADLVQAGFAAVKQFHGLGSRKTGIGVMCQTIGAPAWDATGGKAPSVSANDFVIGAVAGQRLDWLHPAVSIGVQAKAIQSRMDTYSAFGTAIDAGLLIRPGRFRLGHFGLGVFDYGIVTFGASVLHLGSGLTYDRERTLLPTTWRCGVSLKAGRYAGWSWLLASDALGVRGRDPVWAFGSEVWWRDFLGVRFGARSNGKDLGDFSFGFGLRWDDAFTGLLGMASRFGNAVQADLADAGFGDVLRQTYRGGLSQFPSSPEPFDLYDPDEAVSSTEDVAAVVELSWEPTEDPDPFDEIEYLVLVDGQKSRVENAVRSLEREGDVPWRSGDRTEDQPLTFSGFVSGTTLSLPVQEGGNYFWAVAAVDRGHHVRMAKKGKQKIARFMVAVPDLIVSEIAFAPAQTINDTPDQGVLSVHIGNRGSAASDTAWLAVEGIPAAVGRPAETLFRGLVEPIPVNGTATVTFPWMASMPGRYTIRATADPDSLVLELREDNNTAETAYVTVPKGILMAPDSVQVMATGYSRLEVPLVPEMYFDPNSEDIGESYTANTGVFPALLPTLSARLQENPDIVLRVMGAIDALSGETDTGLADRRAERVKEKLVELGAPAAQINVVGDHPSKVLGRRPMPKNPQDAEWVMEQNRVVTFATETQSEEVMFQPYEFAVDTTLRDSVQFVSKIVCPAGLKVWEIEGQTGILELDSRRAADGDSLWGVLIWRGTDQSKVVVPRNRWYHFALTVTDSLDRTFRTAIDSIYLEEKRTVERQELFGAAKFAKVEPVYAFYWDRVMSVASEMIGNPGMRLRFEGHACAIGPDKVNERLSTRRAADFTQKFLERVKAKYPQNYENIRRRIAEPMGAGEREPLILKLKGIGEVLMGDNRTPTGRYLNRRIAVLLYREN